MACNNLTLGIDPSCTALKKRGGVAPVVYIGQNSWLDSYTINESTLDIEAISLELNGSVPYKLKRFKGKKLKHSATSPLEVGENVNVFNQNVLLRLYYATSLEMSAIEALANAPDTFVFLQNGEGQIEVYGIDTQGSASSDDPLGGLNASAGEGGTGILLNDDTSYLITLSGQHRIMKRIFNISTSATLAENLAYLNNISEY